MSVELAQKLCCSLVNCIVGLWEVIPLQIYSFSILQGHTVCDNPEDTVFLNLSYTKTRIRLKAFENKTTSSLKEVTCNPLGRNIHDVLVSFLIENLVVKRSYMNEILIVTLQPSMNDLCNLAR